MGGPGGLALCIASAFPQPNTGTWAPHSGSSSAWIFTAFCFLRRLQPLPERLITSVYTEILQENTASSVSYRLARPQAILLAARCPLQKKTFFYTFANPAPEIAQLQNQTHDIVSWLWHKSASKIAFHEQHVHFCGRLSPTVIVILWCVYFRIFAEICEWYLHFEMVCGLSKRRYHWGQCIFFMVGDTISVQN